MCKQSPAFSPAVTPFANYSDSWSPFLDTQHLPLSSLWMRSGSAPY